MFCVGALAPLVNVKLPSAATDPILNPSVSVYLTFPDVVLRMLTVVALLVAEDRFTPVTARTPRLPALIAPPVCTMLALLTRRTSPPTPALRFWASVMVPFGTNRTTPLVLDVVRPTLLLT